MKKYICFTALFLFSINQMFGQAPSYGNWELDIVRIGYTTPVGDDVFDAGISWGGELRYNLKDNFSIGFSTQYQVFAVSDFLRNDSGDGAASFTLELVGDYYFNSSSPNRFFAGGGLGFKNFGEYSFVTAGITEEKEDISGLCFSPRVGYELGHLRLLANLNLGLKDDLPSHFSIMAALTIGGGYNK